MSRRRKVSNAETAQFWLAAAEQSGLTRVAWCAPVLAARARPAGSPTRGSGAYMVGSGERRAEASVRRR